MALNRYFAHEDLQGRDFIYRYEKTGYDCKIIYNVTGGYYWYAMGAENIFQNNLYSSITYIGGVPHYNWNTQEEIANSTVQGWMGSPGHRKNILISYWENEGIGIVIGVDDKVYITENFC